MLEVTKLSKEYSVADTQLWVLSEINMKLDSGDAVSIVGPSGSGKSTLLYILGALEPPSAGTVMLDGENPYDMDEKRVAAFRNRKIGFVFQDHHLLPQCTVIENVLIPTLVVQPDDTFEKRAYELIEQVGLGSRIDHHPHELSGGEKQRVALARALIMQPRLLLCDEPTGNLDRDSTEAVTSLLLDLHRNQGNILVVVTHNLEVAAKFKMRCRLSDARLSVLEPSILQQGI
jgi:lipoprotein-releasing system ATP-binding protein